MKRAGIKIELARSFMTFDVRFAREKKKTEVTAEPGSHDQILRRGREQGNIHFPFSVDHV